MSSQQRVPLTLIPHRAAALNARTPAGRMRGVARKLGFTHHADSLPDAPAIVERTPGRVVSAGVWQSAAVSAALAAAIGAPLGKSLRSEFEWYLAQGAFFHNDAHYEDVLFGVWCVGGPPSELVFPRIGARLDVSPGAIAVFDPFEVHGLLKPGREGYSADDYTDADPSVFVGFELELTPVVAAVFDIEAAGDAPIVSSATRIDASTGAIV